jgi:hypothetical protein
MKNKPKIDLQKKQTKLNDYKMEKKSGSKLKKIWFVYDDCI